VVRASECAAAVADIKAGTVERRADFDIEFQEQPKFILDKQGNPIAVDAMVRVYVGGVEQQVDPHRICINPPMLVPDGTTHTEFLNDGTPYEADNFREDPREAYLTWLEQSIRGVPNAKGWNTRGTVTTVFATAPGGNSQVESFNGTYATCRTGSNLGPSGPHLVGQTTGYAIDEAFVIFDTSGIPDTDTVSDVVLSLDGSIDLSTQDFTVVAASSAYDGGQAVTSDWVSGASLSALTTYATWASSGYSANYNAFTSAGAAFNSAINKTGNTPLMLYSDRHSAGTTPTTSERVSFDDADTAGTTSDPKLDITHSSGATAGGPLAAARHLSGGGMLTGRLAG
jgi:hypothetical protein